MLTDTAKAKNAPHTHKVCSIFVLEFYREWDIELCKQLIFMILKLLRALAMFYLHFNDTHAHKKQKHIPPKKFLSRVVCRLAVFLFLILFPLFFS